MSLTISCPITGAAFRLPTFGGNETPYTIRSPHPLLTTSLSQLEQLELPESAADRHILLCAYLEKLAATGIVLWNGALTPTNFSGRWIEQQWEQFRTLAVWLCTHSNHPAHNIIPQLALDADLTSENLQSWRESAQAIISSYDTFFDTAESRRLREAQEAAARLLDENGGEVVASADRRAKSRRNYVASSLALHENQDAVEQVLRVLAKPYNFELVLLQQVKAFCLDFLPENGHENYNDKVEVMQLLDAAILDRVGMAQLLGVSNSADDAQAIAIRANYTTAIGAQVFTTTTNPKLAAVINRRTQDALLGHTESATTTTLATESKLPTYVSEPKLQDFKHRLAYEIAMKYWKAQQVQAKSATSSSANIQELL